MRGARMPLLVLALLAVAGDASAHRNAQLVDGTERIAAGDVRAIRGELHFHRLVGTVEVVDPQAGDAILVRAVGAEGERVLAGPGTTLRLNTLIACCDGVVWAEHTFRIENAGPRAVMLAARLALLHDGLAIAAYDSEDGAAVSILVIAGLPAALALVAIRRGPRAGSPRRWIAASAGAYAAMWLAAGGASLLAMRAYGAGPAAGTIAIAADLPWLDNPILTTQDVLMLAFLALWIAALSCWAGAIRRGASKRIVGALSAALILAPIVACTFWAREYGAWLVPVGGALLAVAAPLAWALPPVRRALL